MPFQFDFQKFGKNSPPAKDRNLLVTPYPLSHSLVLQQIQMEGININKRSEFPLLDSLNICSLLNAPDRFIYLQFTKSDHTQDGQCSDTKRGLLLIKRRKVVILK